MLTVKILRVLTKDCPVRDKASEMRVFGLFVIDKNEMEHLIQYLLFNHLINLHEQLQPNKNILIINL